MAAGSWARSPGLPPIRPRLRAERRPALVRSHDQCPLELRDGAQDLQREHALRCRGVDRVAQAAEMRALGFELLDDGEQMADRAGEAVEPDHDQGLARARISRKRRVFRANGGCFRMPDGALETNGVRKSTK
jgi:hypothetical protein